MRAYGTFMPTLEPYTDRRPRNVVNLSENAPRNRAVSSPIATVLLAAVIGVIVGFCMVTPPLQIGAPLLGVAVVLLGLALLVWWHRRRGWTATLGPLRVYRRGRRLVIVDPRWPERIGPALNPLRIACPKAMVSEHFPPGDCLEGESLEGSSEPPPHGYREAPVRDATVRSFGRPGTKRISNAAFGFSLVHAIVAIVVLSALMGLLLDFNALIAWGYVAAIVVLPLLFGVALRRHQQTSMEADLRVEDSMLFVGLPVPFRVPLSNVVAFDFVGGSLCLWIHDGAALHRVLLRQGGADFFRLYLANANLDHVRIGQGFGRSRSFLEVEWNPEF